AVPAKGSVDAVGIAERGEPEPVENPVERGQPAVARGEAVSSGRSAGPRLAPPLAQKIAQEEWSPAPLGVDVANERFAGGLKQARFVTNRALRRLAVRDEKRSRGNRLREERLCGGLNRFDVPRILRERQSEPLRASRCPQCHDEQGGSDEMPTKS